MKGLKILMLGAAVGLIAILCDCGDIEVAPVFDRTIQFEEDSLQMAEYITGKGYNPASLDTNTYNVIYLVIDEGDGESIAFDDIVTYNYNMRNAEDSILKTTIRANAVRFDTVVFEVDTISYDSTSMTYEIDTTMDLDTTILADLDFNRKFTYAVSSWTVAGLFNESLTNMNAAYSDALIKVIGKLKVGGHGKLIMPSPSYLENNEFFSEHIWVVDIMPVFVRKANE